MIKNCERCKEEFEKPNGKYCSRRCYFGPQEERFWAKIRKSNGGCLMWTGGKDMDGYGRIQIKGERRAHRVSWVIHNGEIPHGLQVLHKCDKPSCCNIDHLFLGTPADNVKDRCNKRRSSTPKGEKARSAKLRERQIKEIKWLYKKKGWTQRKIANKYGVCNQNISLIVNNRSWKHSTCP